MIKPRLIFTLCSVIISHGASAGAIRISPVSFNLNDNQQATSLTLFNQSFEPENIQVRVFSWKQDAEGKESLVMTNDLVASPSVMSVAASSSFNVRIVRLNSTPVNEELAYRVVIDELPTPNDPRKNSGNVRMLLRTLLPVFITNDNLLRTEKLSIINRNGQCLLQVKNTGQRHLLLKQVSINDSSTQQKHSLQMTAINGYVLPQHSKEYVINDMRSCVDTSEYQITANINDQIITK